MWTKETKHSWIESIQLWVWCPYKSISRSMFVVKSVGAIDKRFTWHPIVELLWGFQEWCSGSRTLNKYINVHTLATEVRCWELAVQVLLTFINKVELIRFAFNFLFSSWKTLYSHSLCTYAVSTTYQHTWFWQRGSFKISRIIVAQDGLCKAQLRATYIFTSYNLCSISIHITAKFKLIPFLCTHIYSCMLCERCTPRKCLSHFTSNYDTTTTILTHCLICCK